MRVGLTTSVIGHTLLLAWGLVSLPSAKPFDVQAQVDALPVDLIPLSDVTRISEGKKTAPKKETASTGKAKPPTPRPESQKIGNARTDQDAPVTEKTTDTAAAPTRQAAAPTPPPPPPAPERPKAPEKAPTPPAPPEPAPAPEPEPVKTEAPKEAPKPTAEVAELPAEPEKQVETPPAPTPAVAPKSKPKPPAPVQTAALDPKPAPPSKETKRSEEVKPVDTKAPPKEEKTETFNPDDINALLNKVDPSGGGSQASTEEASLGSEKATGPVADMSQSEIDALRSAVAACWNYPAGADGAENLVVRLRIEFTPDGDVAGTPAILEQPAGPLGTVAAEGAVRAVLRCAPYTFLPPEKYEVWQVVNFRFNPAEMF
ncbi:cell envelope biogenesis protein TolA [Chthonobacter rhizosphaerae]|uniref:cell envelope biogenesis protein TolA n=1 Tax=Chthonobacter rhizosphaerae TaxID=2735553 RepID=UPI0015EE6E7D|nr:cell envelope biogenesis protein TolA [Chthonobacter rhizosphaerae]